MGKKILIIQTAFIGDAILGTAVLESLHHLYPDAELSYLVRKGNESILNNHPFVYEVLIFDKKNKYKNLIQLIRTIRSRKYDLVINLQRFFTTGLITISSGAKTIIGFDKNPLSFLFTKKAKHFINKKDNYKHEIERNWELLKLIDSKILLCKPKLYTEHLSFPIEQPYVCVAPFSIWYTKQYPKLKWVELIQMLVQHYTVYLIGAPSDREGCDDIVRSINNSRVINSAGQYNLLQSAALMKGAQMNYANDSAPLHLASAVDAPITAIFCSTVPEFGFTPLSTKNVVLEKEPRPICKPCGLHGKKECPLGHFNCGGIPAQSVFDKSMQLLKTIT
jgi:ADP-heptose:LPS heptosyltransferase